MPRGGQLSGNSLEPTLKIQSVRLAAPLCTKGKLRSLCLSTSMHETSSVGNLSYKYKNFLLPLKAVNSPSLCRFSSCMFCDRPLCCAPPRSWRFLIAQAEKLDLSLPPCQRGEELGAKLQDGCIFLFSPLSSRGRTATFKDVWRPSQLMLLKCHLALNHDSKGPIWSQKEHIVPHVDCKTQFQKKIICFRQWSLLPG